MRVSLAFPLFGLSTKGDRKRDDDFTYSPTTPMMLRHNGRGANEKPAAVAAHTDCK
jgi:hypothetical protein